MLAGLGYTSDGVVRKLWELGRLSDWMIAGGLDADDLSADRVQEFSALCKRGDERPAGRRTLEPLLRHLRVLGVVPAETVGAAPTDALIFRYRAWMINDRASAVRTVGRYEATAARWRDTALPPTLTRAEVEAILAACDRATVTGRRDFAIVMILARLGLRAAEVGGLELGDVDWRAGELVVWGKARRDDRLPLPVDVGEAIVAYLQGGRPDTPCRAVFVTRFAPLKALAPQTVSKVVYAASGRAGMDPKVCSHRLRHALVTDMLRHGAALPEIIQVLRHRDLATTAIYAKVDHDRLRELALPWPGSQPQAVSS